MKTKLKYSMNSGIANIKLSIEQGLNVCWVWINVYTLDELDYDLQTDAGHPSREYQEAIKYPAAAKNLTKMFIFSLYIKIHKCMQRSVHRKS